MIREPVFAGQFYPADPNILRDTVTGLLKAGDSAASAPEAFTVALIAPHAGYIYSGRVAGATYAAARLPDTLVILCPNHTGLGRPVAVMNRGGWETPLGHALIDESLADRVLDSIEAAEADDRAHRGEHSLEVQIPFLQVKLGPFRFVPICIGTDRLEILTMVGRGLHSAMTEHGTRIGIIISSDMSHYISADTARMKDMMAIERITALDPAGLHRVVRERDISMCGYAPAVAGLTAAVEAGASAVRLVAYSNSGETSGDYDQVVGYAGLTIS